MINEIISMNGYGVYVWSAFSFTLITFTTLYFVTKLQLLKEQKRFAFKFGSLNIEKARAARSQNINREILSNISKFSSKTMYGKKVKLRFVFLVLVLTSVILTVFLVLQSLKENVIYFQSPSEIKSLIELNKQKIRVGGMVKEQSLYMNSKEINFVITDFKNEINVVYSGAVPNLFAEGREWLLRVF